MKIIIIIGVIVIVILLYLIYEKNALAVTYYSINNKKKPKDFDGYKIIQVSDFHSIKNNKLVNDIIYNIKKAKPNIIVITGDLISNSKEKNLNKAIFFIKKIKGIAPIYFISGNHEARINNYDKLKRMLKDQGVTILDNKCELIKYKNANINLIGIDDPVMVSSGYTDNSNIINDELTKANYNRDKFNILLSHRPELFSTYVKSKIDLIFSGHTHGGQIRLPFIGAIYAPNQGLFPKYDCGLFERDNSIMIVSRGIGTSKLPIRIHDRPEIVIVSLETK